MRVRSWILVVAIFTLAGCGQAQFPGVTPAASTAQSGERPSTRSENENVLYSFLEHGDGGAPLGGLVANSVGVFFGTTERGGRLGCPGDAGRGSCGTVFALIPQTTGYYERQLYRFCMSRGCPDGEYPEAGLIRDDRGAFYGTGYEGGAYGHGVVFKLAPDGKKYRESVVYSFCPNSPNCGDGSNPRSSLILGRNDVLYGTTLYGGSSNAGVVFKITPGETHYNETVLHAFSGADGEYPEAGLVADHAGALYGTTATGGSGACYSGACGVVFKLSPTASGYSESTIHTFSGPDGAEPVGGLIVDRHGNLYGTTDQGGNTSLCYNQGCGTVFELSPSGSTYTETLLYAFTGGTDGWGPNATLVMGKNGDLFGSTILGGCCRGGVIFRLRPTGSGYSERVLYSFCSQYRCHDGEHSRAPLILYKNALYGTTWEGGRKGDGTIFGLSP